MKLGAVGFVFRTLHSLSQAPTLEYRRSKTKSGRDIFFRKLQKCLACNLYDRSINRYLDT